MTLNSLSFCGLERQSPLLITPTPTSISTCQHLKLESNGRQASPAGHNCLSNREAISKATKIRAMYSSCDSLCKLLPVKLKFPKRKPVPIQSIKCIPISNAELYSSSQEIVDALYIVHRDKTQELYNLTLNLRRNPVIIHNSIMVVQYLKQPNCPQLPALVPK